jgi:hypothetical protein
MLTSKFTPRELLDAATSSVTPPSRPLVPPVEDEPLDELPVEEELDEVVGPPVLPVPLDVPVLVPPPDELLPVPFVPPIPPDVPTGLLLPQAAKAVGSSRQAMRAVERGRIKGQYSGWQAPTAVVVPASSLTIETGMHRRTPTPGQRCWPPSKSSQK